MRAPLLLGILLAGAGLGLAAATPWDSIGFDGSAFAKGVGAGAIQVRGGYLPVPGSTVTREDQLPEGTGALAVFCYQQRSGGKLRPQRGSAPMAGMVVTITGDSLTLAGRSDASGYLVLALPPGSYEVRLAGVTKKAVVENQKTGLVALRGGKRMVD